MSSDGILHLLGDRARRRLQGRGVRVWVTPDVGISVEGAVKSAMVKEDDLRWLYWGGKLGEIDRIFEDAAKEVTGEG